MAHDRDNITTTKLDKINIGVGASDDGISDQTSNKLGKCDRGRPHTWATLKTP